MFKKRMLRSRRNKKDGAGGNRMTLASDALLAASPKIEQELAMRMVVWCLLIKRLKVSIDPQFRDRPVATTEMESFQENRSDGTPLGLAGIF